MQDERFDEAECLRRIGDGEERAAHDLLRHFHPFVLKLVRAHLPRRTSEEDLVQMIFIKIFQNIDSFRGKMPLQHWISRVAVNTCLNELKAEKIRPEWRLSDFDEDSAAAIERLAQSDPDLATSHDVDAAKRLLSMILAQLAPQDRLLVTMLHIEERSVDEIRALTGWSRSAIKVRLFRARAKMKKMLQQPEIAGLV